MTANAPGSAQQGQPRPWISALVLSSIGALLSCPLQAAPQRGGKKGAQTKQLARYESFGAVGDGKTDDQEAIIRTHEYANRHGIPVRANDKASYYIGGGSKSAVIQTNTNFGKAKFIIDDRKLKNHRAQVFVVKSKLAPISIKSISKLARGQAKLDLRLPGPCLVHVTNSHVRRYIRYGLNANQGAVQTDLFLVDSKGNIDPQTPIIWDFDMVSKITAQLINEPKLRIEGGRFTTIANAGEAKNQYYARGIGIYRCNVVVDRLEHRITDEGKHGAPYGGFLRISRCANVRVTNTLLSGHKTYWKKSASGLPVPMGSYDLLIDRAINVAMINCSQSNDIKDRKFWGIMGSNYCKNLSFDHCRFSRFDAHQGVVHATIRNSTLGYMGINAIGFGTFTVENSTLYGRSLINLRSDYGSTWRGQFIIRNCSFVPACGKAVRASLIGGRNNGRHNFGYTCYMPEKIVIENLQIDDRKHPRNYRGPTIFANFNPRFTSDAYVEKFPYIRTKELVLKNVRTSSKKPLRISDNPFLFTDVKVKTINTRLQRPARGK